MNINVLPRTRLNTSPFTPTAPVILKVQAPKRTITGRAIAHGKRTPVQRALLAADIIAGRVDVVSLTAKQITTMLKTNQVYADAAGHLSLTERFAVVSGMRPLIVKSPAKHAPRSDAEIVAEIVHRRGADHVLEMVVAADVVVAA